jgi:hypothetical protein
MELETKKNILLRLKEVFFSEMEEKVEEKVEEVEMMEKDYKTMDGRIMRTMSLEVGSEIKEVTEDGVIDVLDGDYVMEDKTIVEVEAGKIKMVRKADEVEETESVEVEAGMKPKEFEEAVVEDVVVEETVVTETPAVVENEIDNKVMELLQKFTTELETISNKMKELEAKNGELTHKFSAFSKAPSAEPTDHKLEFNKLSTKEDKLKFFGK